MSIQISNGLELNEDTKTRQPRSLILSSFALKQAPTNFAGIAHFVQLKSIRLVFLSFLKRFYSFRGLNEILKFSYSGQTTYPIYPISSSLLLVISGM